ncbi:GL14208 [Drosophila persimilis]|uniref:GL14208 n=1 Tax=Drosophila persimilis TaxID=7234 RepID=B4GTU4_DROPE|nr:GL14208 [Drosophila persimilis]
MSNASTAKGTFTFRQFCDNTIDNSATTYETSTLIDLCRRVKSNGGGGEGIGTVKLASQLFTNTTASAIRQPLLQEAYSDEDLGQAATTFTVREVQEVTATLGNGKAAGHDGVSNAALKCRVSSYPAEGTNSMETTEACSGTQARQGPKRPIDLSYD